jgi:hypothetical protein
MNRSDATPRTLVKYAPHFTGQAARGIPEVNYFYFWIVPRNNSQKNQVNA